MQVLHVLVAAVRVVEVVVRVKRLAMVVAGFVCMNLAVAVVRGVVVELMVGDDDVCSNSCHGDPFFSVTPMTVISNTSGAFGGISLPFPALPYARFDGMKTIHFEPIPILGNAIFHPVITYQKKEMRRPGGRGSLKATFVCSLLGFSSLHLFETQPAHTQEHTPIEAAERNGILVHSPSRLSILHCYQTPKIVQSWHHQE